MQGVPFENFQHQNDFSSEIVQFFWEEKPIYKMAIISRKKSQCHQQNLREINCFLVINSWRIAVSFAFTKFPFKSVKNQKRNEQFFREINAEKESDKIAAIFTWIHDRRGGWIQSKVQNRYQLPFFSWKQ